MSLKASTEFSSPRPASPLGPSGRAGWLVRAAALCLLPGLGAFLLDQSYKVITQKTALPAISAFSYALIFLATGMAGVALLRLAQARLGDSLGLRGALLVGIAYAATMALLPPVLVVLGHLTVAKVWKRVLLALLGLAMLGLLRGQSRAGLRRALPWLVALLSLAVLWALMGPEQLFLGTAGQVLGVTFLLALLLAVAQHVRGWLRWPLSADLAALGAMILLVVSLQAAVDAKLYHRPPPAPDAAQADAAARKHPPNIVFIVWDTVRRDHLSLYGYPRATTRYLEERARVSRVFTRATTVAPWTLPSHASMFTGLYPRSHGAELAVPPGESNLSYRRLSPGSVTLAGTLARHGYACGAVSANFGFAARRVGMDLGFEYFDDQNNPLLLDSSRFSVQSALVGLRPWMPADLLFRLFTPYMTADQVNARALHWIDSLDSRRPFFLFLNYFDAHFPHYPPERLLHLYPASAVELDQERLLRDMHLGNRSLTEDEKSYLNSLYDAKIYFLDEQLRSLENELRKRRLFDDALVVLVSDHGEFLGEHQLLGHALDVYSEVLNIPLLIKYPGGIHAGLDSSPMENRALFHLVLEQAGVETPTETNPWDAFAERTVAGAIPTKDGASSLLFRTRRAVVFDGHKFISSSDGHDELYSLTDDPREARNLITQDPRTAERGRQLVEQFLNSVPKPTVEEGAHAVSPEEAERLRAVGYVQ